MQSDHDFSILKAFEEIDSVGLATIQRDCSSFFGWTSAAASVSIEIILYTRMKTW